MCPLCCASCGGLSFHSYLPALICTWSAEQDPLCVFLCGNLPGVCLTCERVVIPQQGWPLSFVFLPLCTQECHLYSRGGRKLLKNITFLANRYLMREVDRKEMRVLGKYHSRACTGAVAKVGTTRMDSGSLPLLAFSWYSDSTNSPNTSTSCGPFSQGTASLQSCSVQWFKYSYC